MENLPRVKFLSHFESHQKEPSPSHFLKTVIKNNIKCTILTILSVQFGTVKYIHTVVQQISRTFSSCKTETLGTSLVAQWLRIRLAMQGTRVRALVREDPTCCGATKPMRHNYWAHMPQLLKPTCLEPMLRKKRSHHNTPQQKVAPLATTRESPCATKTQHSQNY